MSGFTVDASFYSHPKSVALRKRPRAMALWLLAGSWSALNHTAGVVNLPKLEGFRVYLADAELLVQIGLWEPVDKGCGYRFHDWQFWNATLEYPPACSGATLSGHDSTRNLAEPVTSGNAPRAGALARGTESFKTTTTSDTFGVGAPERRSVSDPGGIVAGWLESVESRPPSRVVGQVARLVREMQTEGIAEKYIVAGLEAWAERKLHPSVLPSVVHEQQQGRRRSTTDRRVADNLAVVERFARRDGLIP
jgi:hypothetical protein